MFILAYQDFCLSAFLPIIIFATCKSDFRFPFYFLADFLAIFLQSFSKILSSENQKPNTKSLPKAENQTKCCKTIFQKSAESQKCSNNKKTIYQKPKMKQRDPNLCNVFFCHPSQMFSGFQWQNTKQKSAEKIKMGHRQKKIYPALICWYQQTGPAQFGQNHPPSSFSPHQAITATNQSWVDFFFCQCPIANQRPLGSNLGRQRPSQDFPVQNASKDFSVLLLACFFHRNFTPDILTNRKRYTRKCYTVK